MTALIITLHVFVCLFLIIVVLLQPGKGGDLGSAFGGGAQQNIFGARGAVKVLGPITTGSAVVFMVTSIILATIATRPQSTSLLQEENAAPAPITAPKPADQMAPAAEIEIDASKPAPAPEASAPVNPSPAEAPAPVEAPPTQPEAAPPTPAGE